MKNKKLLYVYILAIFTSMAMAFAELPLMPLAYNININYDNDSLSLESLTLEHSYISKQSSNETYIIELFDIYGNKVYNNSFSFPLDAFISVFGCIDNETFNSTRCNFPSHIELNSATQNIVIPYNPTSKNLEIRNLDGELELSIDVLKYAEYCGDGKCTESYLSCPADCKETAEEKTISSKYKEQDEIKNNKGLWNTILEWKYYILGSIGLIIILGMIIKFRHKKQEFDSQTRRF